MTARSTSSPRSRSGRPEASDAVLASLPLSYTPAADVRRRSVAVVDGSGRWSAAVVQALQRGAAGVIVVQPGPEDVGELRAVAPISHGVVVVDSTWASNPVVAAAGKLVQAAIGQHSRLECRIVVRVGTDLDSCIA